MTPAGNLDEPNSAEGPAMNSEVTYVIRSPVEGGAALGFYEGGQRSDWFRNWTPDLRSAALYSRAEAQELASWRPSGSGVDQLGTAVPYDASDYGVVRLGMGRWLVEEPLSDWCGCVGIPRNLRSLWHLVSGRPCRGFAGRAQGDRAVWSWDRAEQIARRLRESSGEPWVVFVADWGAVKGPVRFIRAASRAPRG